MSLSIFTYKNPYFIQKEDFWPSISNCPHFCSSQTLVNGLNNIDKKIYQKSRLATFRSLISYLYPNWITPYAMVKQYAEIDNIIRRDLYDTEDLKKINMYRAFVFNADDVQKSIRTLFELDIKYNDINFDKLTEEQNYIVSIYKKLQERTYSNNMFDLAQTLSEEEINQAITNSLVRDCKEYEEEVKNYDFTKIVVHGIHQFSPLELRVIDLISKVKKVILIFNYQDQFKMIYQTWQDVYDNFGCQINFSNKLEYYPTDPNNAGYLSNIIGNEMGSVCEGKRPSMKISDKVTITQFDSMTEFAGYVASKYEEAVIRKEQDTSLKSVERNVLSYMREKFYCADGSVNDILRIYFPEQFGERKFLNYPLGHFFISIANMWDPKSNEMKIEDLNDVRECIYSSIIYEKEKGELITLFEKAATLFEGCKSIAEIINRLKMAKKRLKYIGEEDIDLVERLSYFTLSDQEINKLLNGLVELNQIAKLFLEDFEKYPENFKSFYSKLRNFLSDVLIDSEGIDEDFRDILIRVLDRLNQVKDINATASFECLKSTMSIYLQQEPKIGDSARWIVKNFEQIDGDILQSIYNKKDIYHFACLSDEDINSNDHRDFSWPLDQTFFEVAQNPLDWKYQVFVTASKEYKNFKRYALIYGLEFNRAGVKLSFVKKGRKSDKEQYYLLKMLGIKEKKHYKDFSIPEESVKMSRLDSSTESNFDHYDVYKFRLCKYKFLLESLLENNTVYKDNFLQLKYFESVLEYASRESLTGDIISHITVVEKVEEEFDRLRIYFPYVTVANKSDLIKIVCDKLLSEKKGTFSALTASDREYFEIKERFYINNSESKDVFSPVSDALAKKELSNEKLTNNEFEAHVSRHCMYCSNKDICLALYKSHLNRR